MYGQIHICIRELVTKKFGIEAWNSIVAKSECDETEDFMVFHHYPDSVTVGMVVAASEVLGVPVATVLEVFGEYFFTYCLQHGYDKMLRTLGDNLETFIQNLDSLHSLLAMSYKNIDAPSFRCERNSDGSMQLHYYSIREGLYPIVIGLVRTVAKELFNQDIQIDVLEVGIEHLDDDRVQHHAAFHVQYEEIAPDESELQVALPTIHLDNSFPEPPETHIPSAAFCDLFPYHILFDDQLCIRQCGTYVKRMSRNLMRPGVWLGDAIILRHPHMNLTFPRILRFINAVYIIDIKANNDSSEKKSDIIQAFSLKGQMVWLEDINHVIFIGSPRVSSLSELLDRNVFLSDIPLYDVTRELVLLNQQRIAEIEVSKKLDETTAELKKTALALENEKQKTDMLLYQMLPVKVADQLRDGNKVDAEKFEQSTILFSDIVTFTNIAAAVAPINVVTMLNSLYTKFDDLISFHGVYKVETIGDAYMVVGGVPEKRNDHAEAVAEQGLDMILKAREVMSPATGEPLEIRVGIHSGPVVAGVVGDKMPRYCLFGDTVNTASRMESHGKPGHIHCSHTTHSQLVNGGYKFVSRGLVEIKGKGKMRTYYMYGSQFKEIDKPIPDPTIIVGSEEKTHDGKGNPTPCEVVKLDNMEDIIETGNGEADPPKEMSEYGIYHEVGTKSQISREDEEKHDQSAICHIL